MFGFSKDKRQNILLVDVYRSYITLSLISKNSNTCKKITVGSALNYLKVADPKASLNDSSFRSILGRLSEKLARKAAKEKIKLQNFHVVSLVHGPISLLSNHEFFVKLKDKEELNRRKIIQLVSKEHLEEEALGTLANQQSDKRYFRSKKLVTRVAPNYYNVNSWEGKKVKELSFLLSQTLILQDFKIKLEDIISELYPGASISFINPNVLFALSKGGDTKHSGNFNILDVGAEFISFYQLYDLQVVNYRIISSSINQLIRDLDRFIASFELAKSAFVSYLKGDCKGDLCKNIKNIMDKFDADLAQEVAKMKINPYLKQRVTIMNNPDLEKELVWWVSDRVLYHLNKKAKFSLEERLSNYENSLLKMFCSTDCHIDEKNQIIIF